MEDKKAEVGIDSYGVSMTTLEEIFLKLGEEEEDAKKKEEEEAKAKANGHHTNGTVAVAANGNGHDKDMSGYSFEAVETKKSSWQMFKSLLFVSCNYLLITDCASKGVLHLS